MAVITTTHDAEGRSIHMQSATPRQIPLMGVPINVLYRTDIADNLVDMNQDADLQCLNKTDELNPRSFFEKPMVVRIEVPPKAGGPERMHRTLSVDFVLIESGEIEHYVDSGEKVLLKKGDLLIQRGTNHYWINPSDTEPVQMLTFCMPAKPIDVAKTEPAK